MTRTPERRRRRIPVFDLTFGVMLGLYAFFIGGVILADFVFVAGTPAGRAQFGESLRDREVHHAVWVSLWTSSLAALIGIAVAVPAGYVLSRGRFPGVRLLDAVVDVPIILPPLVFGISLLVFFQRTFVGPGLESIGLKFVHDPKGIVLVQVLIAAAYGIRMLKGTFDSIDPRLGAVAMTLGSSRARAFFAVTLAQAKSGVIAALVMIWARAIALYGPIMAFVGATVMRTEVMPTRMFLEMNVARLEAALALALMMILMAGVALVVVKLAGRRTDQVVRMTRF